jgi:2-polyprenyl-3-methyl-5-hydroxy-6-metoxy-1,4-benzoquinol methylase
VDRTAYDRHYELDTRHFWRIAKRRLVLECIHRYLPPATDRQVLDIGGACSVISTQLEQFGRVTVVEPDAECVALARSELGIEAIVGALPHDVHVTGPFDLIALLDVLEHIDDDVASLRTIHDLLRPGGMLVLTVPACQWLWSPHDSVLHHYRRYSRKRLSQLLSATGMHVQRISYYTGFLFPAVAAQRLSYRLLHSGKPPKYRVHVPNRYVNSALDIVMTCERHLLRRVNLPFGSALFAVATRSQTARHQTAISPELRR